MVLEDLKTSFIRAGKQPRALLEMQWASFVSETHQSLFVVVFMLRNLEKLGEKLDSNQWKRDSANLK